MTIAVHIAVPDLQDDLRTNFNYHCFTVLAASHPTNHYIFIFDKPFAPAIITEKNITPVMAGPQIKNRLLQYYFYNFKIPRLLNKYNADYFVSTEVCSLRTLVPQCLIINDLSFLKKNSLFTKADARYLKRYTKLFVKRSTKLVVLNPSIRNTLLKIFATPEGKISMLHAGIDQEIPLTFENATQVRNSYTAGKEYFLFFSTASTIANTITMLKAFSIFKKWQKSDMQLVILISAADDAGIKDFSNYKYKADVKIVHATSVGMRSDLIAAAYAAIHLPSIELTEREGLHCLAYSVPLITTDTDFYKNIYKDGSLYTMPAEKEVSEKMMLLYKDENTRNELIKKGNDIVAAQSWQHVAESLQKFINDKS